MEPKIYSNFWSDPEIEPQPHDVKLTALWLLTNERVNLLGYAEVTEKRFAYDTGLPREALAKTFQALAKVFPRFGEGYWIRSYIKLQIGTGDSLVRNHMFKPLARAWHGLQNTELQRAILNRYPEFAQIDLPEGLGAASQAQEQSRAEQSRAEQSRAEGDRGAGKEGGRRRADIPRGIEEAVEFFIAGGSDESEARSFFDHYQANGWKQGGRALIRDWRAAARNWIRRSQDGRPGPKNNFKARTSAEPDAPFDPSKPNAHTGGIPVAN